MTRCLQKEKLHLIHNKNFLKKGTDRCENGKSYLKEFQKVLLLKWDSKFFWKRTLVDSEEDIQERWQVTFHIQLLNDDEVQMFVKWRPPSPESQLNFKMFPNTDEEKAFETLIYSLTDFLVCYLVCHHTVPAFSFKRRWIHWIHCIEGQTRPTHSFLKSLDKLRFFTTLWNYEKFSKYRSSVYMWHMVT